jgi:hypothetical protein
MGSLGRLLGSFWASYPESRIGQAEDAAAEAQDGIREQGFAVRELERQVGRLTVVVIALAEILRERHGVPDEVIDAKVREVERRRVSLRPRARRCDACGRVSGPERNDCMFCGEPLANEPLLPEAEQRPPRADQAEGDDQAGSTAFQAKNPPGRPGG